jgi:hypothetical protein
MVDVNSWLLTEVIDTTEKLSRTMFPNALGMVHHSFLVFLLTPRKESIRKW